MTKIPEYTNNDGENPRRLMDWKDIFELEGLRDEMFVLATDILVALPRNGPAFANRIDGHARKLDLQIQEARQRNYKIEDDI